MYVGIRHQRRGLGHVVADAPQVHDVVVIGFAEVIPDGGVRRHHVRLVAAVGDHVVRARAPAADARGGNSSRRPSAPPRPARSCPRHGAPAAWALSPLNMYSTETSPFWFSAGPAATRPGCCATCVNRHDVDVLEHARAHVVRLGAEQLPRPRPARAGWCPARCSRSITFFTASAAMMFSGTPELWPSPCPGAPSIIGSCYATPGFCEACGISSISEPSEITGLPEPQVATHAVGIPATPRSILKPSFSRMPVRYFEVSNS